MPLPMHMQPLQRWVVLCLMLAEALPAHAGRLEVGVNSVSQDADCFQTVTFAEPFVEPPVVVAMPGIAMNVSDPAMIFLRSITEASFEVCLSEPAPRNGSHPAMEVNFVAVSPGVHLLPDGRVVEAGRVQTLQRQAADCRPLDFPHRGWEWVSFLHPFQVPPTCLVMMQTLNNAVTHVPMTPWLVAAIGGINSTGMEVALDSMKNTEDGTVNSPEEIGYIAFDSQPYTNSAEILADSPASAIQYVIMTTGTLPYMGWGDGDRSEQYVSFTRTFPQASSVVVVAGPFAWREVCFVLWLPHRTE